MVHLPVLVRRLALVPVSIALVLGLGTAAHAVGVEEKVAVMASFTQTGADSYGAWQSARDDQSAWAPYEFDWATDYCSASPDQPLGFDFRLSCARHDWGYRNYHAMDLFPANKPRVDDAFYADLKRKCATYSRWVRSSCYSLAWTYYRAVVNFGNLKVDKAALDHAAVLKADGEARAAASAGAYGAR